MAIDAELESSTDKSQLDKFKEAARELECDEDKVVFEKRLSKLMKPHKPEKSGTLKT